MIIDINHGMLEGFVRAWLKDTLEVLEENSTGRYVHPDDKKAYRKHIKAAKRLLEYLDH
jgi:hypothetical protein